MKYQRLGLEPDRGDEGLIEGQRWKVAVFTGVEQAEYDQKKGREPMNKLIVDEVTGAGNDDVDGGLIWVWGRIEKALIVAVN